MAPTASSTVRESGWNTLLGLAPALAAFALTPAVIDQLGIATFGFYQSLAALVAFAGVLNFGLGPAMIRLVAANVRHPDRAIGFIATTNGLTLAAAIVGALAVVAATKPIDALLDPPDSLLDATPTALRLTAVLLVVALLRAQVARVLQAHHRFSLAAGVEAAVYAATLAGIAAVGWWGGGLIAAVTVRLVVEAAALLVVALRVGTDLGTRYLSVGIAAGTLGPIAAFAPYAAAAQIANVALASADRLLVAGLSGAEELPLYAVPMTVSTLVSSIGARLGMTLFPLAAHLEGGGAGADRDRRVEDAYVRAGRVLMVLAVGGPVILAVAGQDLLGVWIDAEFAAASGVTAPALMVLSGLALMSVVPSAFASGIGRPKISAVLAALRLVLALGAGILLTEERGPEGMAIALLLAAGVTVPVLAWFVERRLIGMTGARSRRVYVLPLLVLIVTAAAAVALREVIEPTTSVRAMLYLVVASAIHLAAVLGLGAIPADDRRILRRGLTEMFTRRSA